MFLRFGDTAMIMGFFIPRVFKMISLVFLTAVAVRPPLHKLGLIFNLGQHATCGYFFILFT
jgi:hypothetical protein